MNPSGRVVLDYLDDIIGQIEKVRGFIDTMDFDASRQAPTEGSTEAPAEASEGRGNTRGLRSERNHVTTMICRCFSPLSCRRFVEREFSRETHEFLSRSSGHRGQDLRIPPFEVEESDTHGEMLPWIRTSAAVSLECVQVVFRPGQD